MAPVAFGSISNSSLTFVGTSRSTTVTCPTGTTTGDLLLLIGQNEAVNPYSTVPTGFTLIAQPTSNSSDIGSAVWYKFATGSDVAGSTNYTVTEGSTGTTSQANVAVCVRYTGVDSTQFPLAFNFTSNNPSAGVGLKHNTTTTAANAQCPAPTNPTAIGSNDMAVRVYMSGDDATGTGKTITGSPPSGWSQRGSYITNNSGKYNQATVVVDRLGALDSATISTNHLSMWDIYTIVLPGVPSPTNQFMPFFGL